jgi:hypothetical protein
MIIISIFGGKEGVDLEDINNNTFGTWRPCEEPMPWLLLTHHVLCTM